MPIRVLPIGLVNKIAAGEVIERPASVVKELVENALDAGAAAIDVAVEDGGRRLIRVTDDGAGMGREDLALAFAPHSTSKIATEEDLFDIRTMGFRGEALASVAAVSRAHIRTRKRKRGQEPFSKPASAGEMGSTAIEPSGSCLSHDEKVPDPFSSAADAAGHEVEALGGEISPVRPCAAAEGTTITVRDLFFNVPARRKFLRAAATELGHVAEQVTRLALANPRVAFSLSHNGRGVQRLPAVGGTLERARDLFGDELAGGLMPIARRGGAGAVSVGGLIGSPSSARASGRWQYFFLNGRYIRDRVLAHALREAYRGACDPSRWPVAIVFVEIDPAAVDVNVHPTKIEVRFRDSDRVHGEVLAALRETLNRSGATAASLAGAGAAEASPASSRPSARTDVPPPAETDAPVADEQRRESLRQAMADFFRSAPSQQPRFSFPEPPPRPPAPMPSHERRDGFDRPVVERETGPAAWPQAAARAPAQAPPAQAASEEHAPVLPPPAAIQVHSSYILAGCRDGVLIIDQHALHERILYNELKRRLEAGGGLEGQRLLIPAPVRVSPQEAATLAAREPLLRRLGVEVAPFGPGSVAVQGLPSMLAARGAGPEEFLRELLDKLSESPGAGPEAIMQDVLAVMACKAAVKAGQPLSTGEIESLLAQAELAERSFACPHGRPAVLKLTLKDLERQFKRA